MQSQDYSKNRYLRKHYKKLRKKELEEYTYPDAEKFKIVYLISASFIALSILFPVIRNSLSLEFFWDDSYYSPWELIYYMIPVVFSFIVVLLVCLLNPALRSRIIFGLSAIIMLIGILIALVGILFASGTRQIVGIFFSALIIITPLAYYSFNSLLTKFNNKRLKTLSSIFAVLILIILLVPMIDNDPLIVEILSESDSWFFIIPIFMLIGSTILTFVNYFSKKSQSNARINSYLLKGVLILFPLGIIIVEGDFDVRDFSYLFKGLSAIYGSFFLICTSFVEFMYVRMTIKITPFARPIIDRNADIVHEDESQTIFEKEDESDPYKSPIEIKKEEQHDTEQR